MATSQLVIVCVTVLLILIFWPGRSRETPAENTAPPRIGHRVTVHTKQPDDQTIFGVITGDYTDRIVLEDAELVHETGAQPLPGKQLIATRDISWIDLHDQVVVADHATAPAETE